MADPVYIELINPAPDVFIELINENIVEVQSIFDDSVFLRHDGSVPFTGDQDANGNTIKNISDPVDDGDAANKSYVDSAVDAETAARIAADADEVIARNLAINAAVEARKIKDPVRILVDANVVKNGQQSIQTLTILAGERVFLQNQANPADNGIWDVQNGAWNRSADASIAPEIIGAEFNINEGTYANQTWRITNGSLVLGTTAITSAQMFAATPDATPTIKGKMKLFIDLLHSYTDGTVDQATLVAKFADIDDAIAALGNPLGYIPEDVARKLNDYNLVTDPDNQYPSFTALFTLINDSLASIPPAGDSWSLNATYIGAIDGSNTNFITPENYRIGSLMPFYNGVLQDYTQLTETGVNTFTMAFAPDAGSSFILNYIKG